jgi:hypothetical protein
MYLPFAYEPDPTVNSLTFCTKSTQMSGSDLKYADAMIDVLKRIQEWALEQSRSNSQEWFGKSTEAFADANDSFTMPLKETAQNRYPPHLKVRYYREADSGVPQFTVYDGTSMSLLHSRQQRGDVQCSQIFATNTRHVVIIECPGIWSLNKRGGLTWRLTDDLYYEPVHTFPFKGVVAEDFNRVGDETYSEAPRLAEETEEVY